MVPIVYFDLPRTFVYDLKTDTVSEYFSINVDRELIVPQ